MQIDPVVVLVEEVLWTEKALAAAEERKFWDVTSHLLAKLRHLHTELLETEPTSAVGAGELILFAANRLPARNPFYADQLRIVANRLKDGIRYLPDLIWLRRMTEALANGVCGERGVTTAPMIRLAIKGAARPVLIFRSSRE